MRKLVYLWGGSIPLWILLADPPSQYNSLAYIVLGIVALAALLDWTIDLIDNLRGPNPHGR